jgi:adenylate cyclase
LRRLAAIFAADIVGYSRLIREDEKRVLSEMRAQRQGIFEPKLAQYNGRIVKLMGDGLLAEFPSAVEAVQCAVEIQHLLDEIGSAKPPDARIIYRIGINIGDIVVEGEDIFGDGVNVASRLEALAEPGGINISRNVYDQVKDKLDLTFKHKGEREVKNISEPVSVYGVTLDDKSASLMTPIQLQSKVERHGRWVPFVAAAFIIAALGVAGWMWWQPDKPVVVPASIEAMAYPLPDKPSIAVMPFDNISDDESQDYFTDGMTEDLITDLSKISGLFVIARNSSFSYKGQDVPLGRVAEELGVKYVLEGSVRRAGSQVRINAQLIDAISGRALWAERYDGELIDVFGLQDEVVEEIVSALQIQLTPSEKVAITSRGTDNLEAYDYFLRGYEILRSSPGDVDRIRELFERAIELDPGYSRAYANLALTYTGEVTAGLGMPVREALARASQLAEIALRVDDTVPSVHLAMALVHEYQGNYGQAFASVENALSIEPSYADAYALQAALFNYSGTPEEAKEPLDTAFRLNPRFPGVYLFVRGMSFFLQGQYQEAIEVLEEAVERNPNYQRAKLILVAAYAYADQLGDAEWALMEIQTLDPDISLASIMSYYPFKDAGHADLLLNGLKMAGFDARKQ